MLFNKYPETLHILSFNCICIREVTAVIEYHFLFSFLYLYAEEACYFSFIEVLKTPSLHTLETVFPDRWQNIFPSVM